MRPQFIRAVDFCRGDKKKLSSIQILHHYHKKRNDIYYQELFRKVGRTLYIRRDYDEFKRKYLRIDEVEKLYYELIDNYANDYQLAMDIAEILGVYPQKPYIWLWRFSFQRLHINLKLIEAMTILKERIKNEQNK